MSEDKERALLEAAQAVADDTPVDWQAFAERVGDARTPLPSLQVVASVASVYRRLALPGGAEPPLPVGGPQSPGAKPLFCWGRLETLEKLGEGAFGEVYRAYDPLLDRQVALKLRRSSAASALVRQSFIREARHLARVRHPNVAVVHGADEIDGRIGIWMDLIDGETLNAYLEREGKLGADEAARIGLDLARALAAVHAAGLVHGDVKAANVLRERGGRIILGDFGAGSELSDRPPSAPVAIGTPLVMAPELLQGARPSAASDIYSLGVLLFLTLTGRYPVDAANLPELRDRHQRGDALALGDLRPDLPAELVSIVERALAPEPERRYPSAGSVQRDLARWLAREAHSGRWSGRFVRTAMPSSSWFWLHRWWLFGAAALLAGFSITLLVRFLGERRPTIPAGTVKTLAVLPFAGPGGDEQSALGLGVADAVINRLSRSRELQVSPTSAVLRYTDAPSDRAAVGQTLGVDAVLAGLIQRADERIRVTVQLITTADGVPVWAATFDEPVGDIFRLQDSIAERVAGSLQLRLAEDRASSVGPSGTGNQEAHRIYLLGSYFLARRTGAALERAIAHFERAVALDTRFVAAHVRLAEAYCALPTLEGATTPPAQAYASARASAERALGIDPDDAAAHAVRGIITMRHEWRFDAAEQSFARALELDPDCVQALLGQGQLFGLRGQHDRAIAAVDRAVGVDPLSAPVLVEAASVYFAADRLDDAEGHLVRTLELDPSFHPAYAVLAEVYARRELAELAVSNWQNAMALAGGSRDDVTALGASFAAGGMPGVWRWRVQRLHERARTGWISQALLARAEAALGEREAAVDAFANAIAEHDELALGAASDPVFASLRNEARLAPLWQQLAR
jgi:TolB-like protein/tetratricopeptide (TPR) repeat protein/tRNA A-37 threonylcarbamoyl transferase component Bud32